MLARLILGWLFPARCPGCGAPGERLCALCVGSVRPTAFDLRDIPGIGRDTPELRLVSCGRYKGPLRRATLKLKQDGRTSLAAPLATHMAEVCRVFGVLDRGRPLVVPVPSSRVNLRWRGYHPAGLLARELAQRLDLGYASVLSHCGRGPAQKLLSGRGRRERGDVRFAVRDAMVGQAVLLVDDVVTTGETLRHAAATLRAAGARLEGAVVLGHSAAPDGGLDQLLCSA